MKPTNPIKLKQCRFCEKLFYASVGKPIQYCSDECRRLSDLYKKWIKRRFPHPTICKVCRKPFEKQYHNQNYCSPSCQTVGLREAHRARNKTYRKYLEMFKVDFSTIHERDWAHKKEAEIEKQIMCFREQE